MAGIDVAEVDAEAGSDGDSMSDVIGSKPQSDRLTDLRSNDVRREAAVFGGKRRDIDDTVIGQCRPEPVLVSHDQDGETDDDEDQCG